MVTMETLAPMNKSWSVPHQTSTVASVVCTPDNPCIYEYVDYSQIPVVRWLFIVLYILIIILALLGNTLVIWTVKKNPSLHNLTNYYIVNLSVSDICIAVFVMPMRLIEYTAPLDWQIYSSDILCGVVQYIMPVFVFSSVLTLIAVSIERYQAVIDPFSSLHASRSCRRIAILVTIWLVPIILCIPFVYFKSHPFIFQSSFGTIHRQMCLDRYDEIDVWLHGPEAKLSGHFRKGFFVILFIIMYMLPLLIITFSSFRIAVHLLMVVERIDVGRRSSWLLFEENKRKVAKMVIVVAIFFFTSWTPFYLVNIISVFNKDFFESNLIFILLFIHFVGFSNCCVNPFIYIIMCDKFNDSFKKVVKKIRFSLCGSHRPRAHSSVSIVQTDSGIKSDTNSFRIKSWKSRSTNGGNTLRSSSLESGDDSDQSSSRATAKVADPAGKTILRACLQRYSTSTVRESVHESKGDQSDTPTVGQKSRRVSIVMEKLEQEFPKRESSGLIMVPNLKKKSVKKLLRKISTGALTQGLPGTPKLDREELDQWKGSLHCLLDIQLADNDDDDDDENIASKQRSWSSAPNLSSDSGIHASDNNNGKDSEKEDDNVFIENVIESKNDVHSPLENCANDLEINDRTRILDARDGGLDKDDSDRVKNRDVGNTHKPNQKSETLSLSDVEVSLSEGLQNHKENSSNESGICNEVDVSEHLHKPRRSASMSKIDASCQTCDFSIKKNGYISQIEKPTSVMYNMAPITSYNGVHHNNGLFVISVDEPKNMVKYDNNGNLCAVSLEEARQSVIENHTRKSQELLSRHQVLWNRNGNEKSDFKRQYGNQIKNGYFMNERQESPTLPTMLKHKAYTRVSRSGTAMTTFDGSSAFRMYGKTSPPPSPRSRPSSPPKSPARTHKRRRSPTHTPRSQSGFLKTFPTTHKYHRHGSNMGEPEYSVNFQAGSTSPKHYKKRSATILSHCGQRVYYDAPSPSFGKGHKKLHPVNYSGFQTDSDMELTYTLKMRPTRKKSISTEELNKAGVNARMLVEPPNKSLSSLANNPVQETVHNMVKNVTFVNTRNSKGSASSGDEEDGFDSEGSIYLASTFAAGVQQHSNQVKQVGAIEKPKTAIHSNIKNSRSSTTGNCQVRGSPSPINSTRKNVADIGVDRRFGKHGKKSSSKAVNKQVTSPIENKMYYEMSSPMRAHPEVHKYSSDPINRKSPEKYTVSPVENKEYYEMSSPTIAHPKVHIYSSEPLNRKSPEKRTVSPVQKKEYYEMIMPAGAHKDVLVNGTELNGKQSPENCTVSPNVCANSSEQTRNRSPENSPKRRRSGVAALNEHQVPIRSSNPDIIYLDIITRNMQEMISHPSVDTDTSFLKTVDSKMPVNNNCDENAWENSFQQQISSFVRAPGIGGRRSPYMPPTILEETISDGDVDGDNDLEGSSRHILNVNGNPRSGGQETVALNMCFGMGYGSIPIANELDDSVIEKREIGQLPNVGVDCKVPYLSGGAPKPMYSKAAQSKSRQRKITPVLQATATKLRRLIATGQNLNGSREQLYTTNRYEEPVHI